MPLGNPTKKSVHAAEPPIAQRAIPVFRPPRSCVVCRHRPQESRSPDRAQPRTYSLCQVIHDDDRSGQETARATTCLMRDACSVWIDPWPILEHNYRLCVACE